MLDDAAVEEDIPQPREDVDNWFRREIDERRIRLAENPDWLRNEAVRNERAGIGRVERVYLGVGPNGVGRVGIWDTVMQRYNIRDEE